jgi:hypothetical protein
MNDTVASTHEEIGPGESPERRDGLVMKPDQHGGRLTGFIPIVGSRPSGRLSIFLAICGTLTLEVVRSREGTSDPRQPGISPTAADTGPRRCTRNPSTPSTMSAAQTIAKPTN